jgi:alkylation response protein AidB-like acyl-CoA dehydrogenase
MELQMFKSVFLDALDAAEEQRQDMPLAISHAKLLANDVSQLICNEAIQMHGGMGITDELDIGLFYKRARVLRTAYGSSAWHKQRCADLSGF